MDETLQPPDDVSRITDKKTVLDWFDTTVEIRVKDLRLDMAMSTVIGLADLAEDEIIAKPLPIRVSIIDMAYHPNTFFANYILLVSHRCSLRISVFTWLKIGHP